MKVNSGKSASLARRSVRLAAYALVIVVALFVAGVQHAHTTPSRQKIKLNSGRLNRDAKKAIRDGRDQEALGIYRTLLEADSADGQAPLRPGFAHFKTAEDRDW